MKPGLPGTLELSRRVVQEPEDERQPHTDDREITACIAASVTIVPGKRPQPSTLEHHFVTGLSAESDFSIELHRAERLMQRRLVKR
jgi:hypothetical protein